MKPPYEPRRKEVTYPTESQLEINPELEPTEHTVPGDRILARVGNEWVEMEVVTSARAATGIPQWRIQFKPTDQNRSRRFEGLVLADGTGIGINPL